MIFFQSKDSERGFGKRGLQEVSFHVRRLMDGRKKEVRRGFAGGKQSTNLHEPPRQELGQKWGAKEKRIRTRSTFPTLLHPGKRGERSGSSRETKRGKRKTREEELTPPTNRATFILIWEKIIRQVQVTKRPDLL